MMPGRSTHSWAFSALALAVVLTVVHTPLLLGRATPIWDALDFFGPYTRLLGDFAREGRFLFWNPFIHGGSPDYIEPQVGAFSPLLLLTGLAAGGSRHGFELYWLAIWWLAGAGILVLARHLGAPWWGGLIAALGFAFSGFYTGNAEHTSMAPGDSTRPRHSSATHVNRVNYGNNIVEERVFVGGRLFEAAHRRAESWLPWILRSRSQAVLSYDSYIPSANNLQFSLQVCG
jgi:hypothetical protein